MRFLFLLILFAGWLTSCSSPRAYAEMRADPSPERATKISDGAGPADRKLLQSAYLELVAREPDSTVASVVKLAEAYEGFMSESSSSGATIRVPAARLEEALTEISTFAKVKTRRLSGEDVTDEYYDMRVRLDNAEKARLRYLELLAKAATVEEALLVEKELERLAETIDLLKGRMSRIDQLEAYATINVRVSQKVKPGPLGYVVKGAYHAVAWLFVRN